MPSIEKWCKVVIKLNEHCALHIYCDIAVGAVLSSMSNYAFDATAEQLKKPTENSIAKRKVDEIFGTDHQLAVIVPSGDYDREAKVISLVEEIRA